MMRTFMAMVAEIPRNSLHEMDINHPKECEKTSIVLWCEHYQTYRVSPSRLVASFPLPLFLSANHWRHVIPEAK